MENWKDIKGYEGYYQINKLGIVRSLDRVVKGKIGYKNIKGSVIEPHIIKRLGYGRHITEKVYLRIRLSRNKNRKSYALHRLLYETFIGDIQTDYIVDHIDNNSLNNNLDNLQVITLRENTAKEVKKTEKTSNYTGVHFRKERNKWVSRPWINGVQVTVYYGDSEIEAREAYEKAIKPKS